MLQLGLLGKKLSHSLSKEIFTKYFKQNNIDANYQLYEINSIDEFTLLISHTKAIALNVTFPYKTEIIPYLDFISIEAKKIEAVNWIMNYKGYWYGFNTDASAFENHLAEWINLQKIIKAIIIGNGGVSKAVKYVFDKNNISFSSIHRKNNHSPLCYEEIDIKNIKDSNLIVQCTPIGTFPHIKDCIPFPFEILSEKHFVYDMIYNPVKTLFLEKSELQGAKISNGLRMLELQAHVAIQMFEDIFINKKPLDLSQGFYKIR